MRVMPIASVLAVLLVGACLTQGTKDDRRSPAPAPSNPWPAAPPYVPTVDTGPHLDEDALDTENDVVDYARFCKQELGVAPQILAPWNCLEGSEVPVTIDGARPDAKTYGELVAGRIGCDKPAWLNDEPCANYAFVQKRTIAPDVEAYLLCRLRSFTSYKNLAERRRDLEENPESEEAFRSLYEFDSLGMIWTNRRTGKTCFFDYVGKIYGGYVASPEDPAKPDIEAVPKPHPPSSLTTKEAASYWQRGARESWKRPHEVVRADNCVRCHDTGALKASPWISQVMKVPVNDPTVPYHVVGKVFDRWRARFPVVAIDTTPINGERQICTSCHRIGNMATCSTHIAHAIGHTASGKLSASGAAFLSRVWMPPSPADWQGKSDDELTRLWNQKYESHLRKMRCCCHSPEAVGCTTQPLDRPKLEAPVPGSRRETCE